MRCQPVEILKVFRILMYKILRVGTHSKHFVVFKLINFIYKQHYVYLFFFFFLCLVRPAAYGKPKPTSLAPLAVLPPPVAAPFNQVFIVTKPLSKLFTNDTGHFPIRACSGNQ
jgi:hypothetical protein